MKKGIEKIVISVIIVSLVICTTIAIKSLPNNFCKFISWLGKCEETDNPEII